MSVYASYVLLVLTAGVLFYAAMTDLREFRIPNELILVLAGLFVVHAGVSGRWVFAYWNVLVALVVFVVLVYFYANNWVGGGDVKILTVAFLWVGFGCGLLFSILLFVFSVFHWLTVKYRLLKFIRLRDDGRIPFAPAVAGALIVTFLTGCLNPPKSGLPELRTLIGGAQSSFQNQTLALGAILHALKGPSGRGA